MALELGLLSTTTRHLRYDHTIGDVFYATCRLVAPPTTAVQGRAWMDRMHASGAAAKVTRLRLDDGYLVRYRRFTNVTEIDRSFAEKERATFADLVWFPHLETLKVVVKSPYDHSIDALATCVQLRTLDLEHTFVRDFSPLAFLGQLEDLRVAAMGRAGFQVLENHLPRLTRLQITTLRFAARGLPLLPQLKALVLRNYTHDAIADLARLTALERLELGRGHDADHGDFDPSPIARLPNLRALCMTSCHMLDLNMLAQLPQLKELALRSVRVANSNFMPVASLAHLRELVWTSDYDYSGSAHVMAEQVLPQLTSLEGLALDCFPSRVWERLTDAKRRDSASTPTDSKFFPALPNSPT